MDGQTVGIIGGIAGAVIGLGGGLFGTYMAIKNTQTPRERQFMIRMAAGFWLVMVLWMGLPLALILAKVLPVWSFWVILAPFYIGLGPFIRWGNRRQNAIRAADSRDADLKRG